MFQQLDIYQITIIIAFVIGYVCIIFDDKMGVNKATTALLMSVVVWAVLFMQKSNAEATSDFFSEHLASVSQVVLFLFGALTIVEIIHAHGGLNLLASIFRFRSKAVSLWTIGLISFFLSSVLDNLTTTIVMVMMLKKIIKNTEDRLVFGSVVVIAANAGGAWTPIGDVTTTMLWMGGQVSTFQVMKDLFIPSLFCLICSLLWFSFTLRGELPIAKEEFHIYFEPKGKRIFIFGMISLMAVPIIKMATGLPPFMAMLFSMSLMWLITDILHRDHEDRQHLRVIAIMPKLDVSGILFFLGILLAIGALDSAGILKHLAYYLDRSVPSKELMGIIIGFLSAIIDNVPLVAACMGMYDIQVFPADSSFWHLIAYCAGTGGSVFIIGSAAGVAFMGMEKVNFFWYAKKISIPATVGYLGGAGVYFLLH